MPAEVVTNAWFNGGIMLVICIAFFGGGALIFKKLLKIIDDAKIREDNAKIREDEAKARENNYIKIIDTFSEEMPKIRESLIRIESKS